jgi:hypothetical protein
MRYVAFVSLFVLLLASALPAQNRRAEERNEIAHRNIENALNSTRVDVISYEDVDIQEVIRDIARRARANIVVDRRALQDIREDDRKVTIELSDILLGNLLNIVIRDVGLIKSYRNGILYLTTQERHDAVTITRLHDVRDITVRIQDFPAPKIRLRDREDGVGPRIDPPRDDDQPTADDIVEMIEDTIEADWGGAASIRISRGQLVIRAPRSVHADVVKLLAQLRAAR